MKCQAKGCEKRAVVQDPAQRNRWFCRAHVVKDDVDRRAPAPARSERAPRDRGAVGASNVEMTCQAKGCKNIATHQDVKRRNRWFCDLDRSCKVEDCTNLTDGAVYCPEHSRPRGRRPRGGH